MIYPASEKNLIKASSIIKLGGVVAFPTETYYGLAVNPFNEKALGRLFELKKRPTEKAILTLVDSREKLLLMTDQVYDIYDKLIKCCWPGPVTLIFKARKEISGLLTCNTGTIGVRISSNPIARRLCEIAGQPITATSANISGCEAATTAQEVVDQLGDGVDMVVDGGGTPGGRGSTIIASEGSSLQLIRAGAVDFGHLQGLIGAARKP